jgi:hypothetical protein
MLVDAAGRVNYLAGAWRRHDLALALRTLGDPAGAAMRTLAGLVERVEVPDPAGWGRDCDTWDDLDQARTRMEDT